MPTYLRNRLNEFQKEIDMRHSFDSASQHSIGRMQFTNAASANSYIPISTFPPTPVLFSECPPDRRGAHSQNHVCASVLAEVLHPDKAAASGHRHSHDVRATMEIVCTKCGTVKEFRNACVQTVQHYVLENSVNQQQQRNNQNLIFDV